MKKFIGFLMILTIVVVNGQPVRGEPINIHYKELNIDSNKKKNFIYPGCTELKTYGNNECITHRITADLNQVLQNVEKETPCEDIVSSLNLRIDSTGVLSLDSVEGELVNDSYKKILKNGIAAINNLEHIKNKIKPTSFQNQTFTKTFAIPYVIKGENYHLYDSLRINDKEILVYKKCDKYFIKDALSLKNIDTVIGEEMYQKFKTAYIGAEDVDIKSIGTVDLNVKEKKSKAKRKRKPRKHKREKKAKNYDEKKSTNTSNPIIDKAEESATKENVSSQ